MWRCVSANGGFDDLTRTSMYLSPARLQARKRGSCRCRWEQKHRCLGFAHVSAAPWLLCLEPPGPVEASVQCHASKLLWVSRR